MRTRSRFRSANNPTCPPLDLEEAGAPGENLAGEGKFMNPLIDTLQLPLVVKTSEDTWALLLPPSLLLISIIHLHQLIRRVLFEATFPTGA